MYILALKLILDNAWERPTSNYEIPIIKSLIYHLAMIIDPYLPRILKSSVKSKDR